MNREAEAAAAVGKLVQHRKKGSWYEVVKANKEEVYLKAGSKGARSTWKWIALLWHDYHEVTPSAAGEGKESKDG